MREQDVAIPSPLGLAGVLCLPEDAAGVPAMALLGGAGADTRDGDVEPGAPGTLRRIAHRLAGAGMATLRWDRRGAGGSGGHAKESDYETDLEDALAAVRWLRDRTDVDAGRVGVVGHSAGAVTTAQVCREADDVAGAVLLGAPASPFEDIFRWNNGRIGRHWDDFTAEQRAWLEDNLPVSLVRGEQVERYIEAARAGDPMVRLEGHGASVELPTARIRQFLATGFASEFRHVRCPALVLHGGDDLTVPAADALTAFSVLRDAGNDEVQLTVLPGADHYFNVVPAHPARRLWDRVSLEHLRRPMAAQALDVIATGAARVFGVVTRDA